MNEPSAEELAADADVQLMLRLQSGDDAALGPLIERNQRRVLALAYRYLGQRDLAEDVVQETFLKVYEARARYKPHARFQAYLLRIATNACVSRLRRKGSVSLNAQDDEGRGREPVDPRAARPGESLTDAEMKERVRAAVDTLPERQRLAILLNKFEGLDYADVGDQLGLSVPATKSLLHRARMALKAVLEGHVGPGT